MGEQRARNFGPGRRGRGGRLRLRLDLGPQRGCGGEVELVRSIPPREGDRGGDGEHDERDDSGDLAWTDGARPTLSRIPDAGLPHRRYRRQRHRLVACRPRERAHARTNGQADRRPDGDYSPCAHGVARQHECRASLRPETDRDPLEHIPNVARRRTGCGIRIRAALDELIQAAEQPARGPVSVDDVVGAATAHELGEQRTQRVHIVVGRSLEVWCCVPSERAQPEVGEPHVSVGVDEEVVRTHGEVDGAHGVGGSEGGSSPLADQDDLGRRQRLATLVDQRR